LEYRDEIINQKPTAGLWEGQFDENELGLSYDELDEILIAIKNSQPLDTFEQKKVNRIQTLIKQSGHKRMMVPVCNL